MENTKDFLQALLAPKNEDVRKTVPMARFGVDFEIKALETDEVNRITQRATRPGPKGTKKLDEDLFNYLMISNACIVPDWEDQNLQAALGVESDVEAIKKRLLFGEVSYLLGEIGELNGFDKSLDEEVEEVKN